LRTIDGKGLLATGEIITVEIEADIKYCRALARDRQARGGGPALLVELDKE
jgi:hypothetical protein